MFLKVIDNGGRPMLINADRIYCVIQGKGQSEIVYDDNTSLAIKEDLIEISKQIARRADDAVKAFPSADRPQGKWVPFEYGDERWHKCTACGVADRYIEYVERPNGTTGKLVAIRNYCPHCGADMREGE